MKKLKTLGVMVEPESDMCKNKMSGERDYSIGRYGKNGRAEYSKEKQNWTDKDTVETGITFREPL